MHRVFQQEGQLHPNGRLEDVHRAQGHCLPRTQRETNRTYLEARETARWQAL